MPLLDAARRSVGLLWGWIWPAPPPPGPPPMPGDDTPVEPVPDPGPGPMPGDERTDSEADGIDDDGMPGLPGD